MRSLISFFFAACLLMSATLAQAASTYFVIVRHAEKAQDDPKDPTLSEAGQARAQRLAAALAHFPIQAIYVSQFRRTGLTAAPTAKQFSLTPTISAVQMPVEQSTAEFIEKLKRSERGKTVLIVGHSNTVPALVKALSGQSIRAIDEATEFDRLYFIELPEQGKMRLLELKY